MSTNAIVVYITVPDVAVGERIAQALLEERLAACVNFVSGVQSVYLWQGKVQRDAEVLLVVKTRADLFETRLVPAVKAVHPYQVPEIIALPVVMGSAGYLQWIGAETAP